MARTLVSLFITASVVVGPTQGYSRGVHFGPAGPSGFIHSARAGFLGRHINFKSLAAPGVVFALRDDPYAHNPGFLPYLCYVALF